jgi:hypothetical protein
MSEATGQSIGSSKVQTAAMRTAAYMLKQPGHFTSMKYELGLCTRRLSLCLEASSEADGCIRSRGWSQRTTTLASVTVLQSHAAVRDRRAGRLGARVEEESERKMTPSKIPHDDRGQSIASRRPCLSPSHASRGSCPASRSTVSLSLSVSLSCSSTAADSPCASIVRPNAPLSLALDHEERKKSSGFRSARPPPAPTRAHTRQYEWWRAPNRRTDGPRSLDRS